MPAYNWFRVYHGTMSDPKWPLIARRSGQTVGTVVAIWMAILESASQHETRGSLEGFCPEEIDALYGYEEGVTQSVFEAMESRGMIEGGMLVAWDKRQGARATTASADNGGAPMTPAERSRRYRERQRELRDEMQRDVTKRDETRDGTFHYVTKRDNGVLQRDETQRDVTKRTDKIREDKKREDLDLPPYIPPTPDADAPASESEGEVPSWLNEPPLPENEMPLPEEASSQAPEVHLQAEPQKQKRKRKKANLRPDDFEAVWAAYPARPHAPDGGKGSKELARKLWDKLCEANELPELEALLATLAWQKQTQKWQDGYIENFSKYLAEGHWKVEKPANFNPNAHTAPPQNRFGQGQPYRGKPTATDIAEANKANLAKAMSYLFGPEESAETVYDASLSPFDALPAAGNQEKANGVFTR